MPDSEKKIKAFLDRNFPNNKVSLTELKQHLSEFRVLKQKTNLKPRAKLTKKTTFRDIHCQCDQEICICPSTSSSLLSSQSTLIESDDSGESDSDLEEIVQKASDMATGSRPFSISDEIQAAVTTRESSIDLSTLDIETPDSDPFIKRMIAYLSEEDVMQGIMNAVSYQGFDPVFIRKLMTKLQPDADIRKKQISFLIVLMLSRGSSIISKTGKVKQETQRYISELVKLYRISKNVVASQSNRETITLPRILNSYPEVGFAVLKKFTSINRPVTVKHMVSLGYDDFESFFRGGFTFSMIPTKQETMPDDTKEAVIKAILAYQVEETMVLTKNKSANNNKELILSEILVYSLASYMSDIVSDKFREDKTNFSSLKKASCSKWKATFNAAFPNNIDIHTNFGI